MAKKVLEAKTGKKNKRGRAKKNVATVSRRNM